MTRCSTFLASFSVIHQLMMPEENFSFELVDSPVMVFPAGMTSTPEKPVISSTNQQPDRAEDATVTAKEPDIEDVKVRGMAEELGKRKLNYEEKSEEPTLDHMEEQFRYKVQKKKV